MPRRKERISVSIQIALEWTSGRREARISDLSMSGCFVDTIAPVSQGEIVSFELVTPEGEKVKLTGEAVYQLPNFGFGVHFRDVSEDQKALLERLVVAYGGNPQSSGDLPAPSRRVIVTGSESATLNSTAQILQQEGYIVVNAENLREAYFHLQSDADFAGAVLNAAGSDQQVLGLANYIKTDKRLQHIPVVIVRTNGTENSPGENFAPEQIRAVLKPIFEREAAEA